MKDFQFELKDFDAGGRIGEITVGNKKMTTPNLFPVVHPFYNKIKPKRIFEHFGAEAVFTNAYIIYNKEEKREEIIKKGIHEHLGFPGIIATDSGGFQDYMYSDDIALEPYKIERFQEDIGSDCPVILDIPVQTTDSYETAKEKVFTTIKRAKDNIKRRERENTAWFGPIHGSVYPDLVKLSATEMSKLDFGIYPIGGVVKTFIDYRFDLSLSILLQTKKYLRPNRPIHMFGLGLPAFFSLAVAFGADTFDSAAYILYAEDERYFTLTGTKKLGEMNEFPCHCPVCTKYTPKKMKKLSKKQRIKLLAEHNLYISFSELRTIREAIKEGNLWDLVEQRVHAHPKLIEGLRVMRKFSEFFDKEVNLSKVKGQNYLMPLSFFRPIFKRYREKSNKYKIPENRTKIVFLPELDVPSDNGNSIKNWLANLKKTSDWEQTQVIILSNLMGVIPWELSEIYPVAQHILQGDMRYNPEQRKILLTLFEEFLGDNHILDSKKFEEIKFVIPDKYIDEYKAELSFRRRSHIIHYAHELIQSKLKNLELSKNPTIKTYNSWKI